LFSECLVKVMTYSTCCCLCEYLWSLQNSQVSHYYPGHCGWAWERWTTELFSAFECWGPWPHCSTFD